MIMLPDHSLCFWFVYILIGLIFSLAVRVVNSFWRALESGDCNNFIYVFKGTSCDNKDENISSDYWQAFFLGWLELMAYPVLIHSQLYNFIGAWLAFKTAHKWMYKPDTERGHYNRYVLANAFILYASFFLSKLIENSNLC